MSNFTSNKNLKTISLAKLIGRSRSRVFMKQDHEILLKSSEIIVCGSSDKTNEDYYLLKSDPEPMPLKSYKTRHVILFYFLALCGLGKFIEFLISL